jgi:multidrug resistance efflux pump
MAEEGSDVTSGAVVVKLDPGEFANQLDTVAEELAQAEAGLAKAAAEGRAAIEGKDKGVQVAEAELKWLEATLATVEAGSAPEEQAKAAAKLAELEVDAEALEKKLEVTQKMAGKGFAGQREVAQLEEQFLQAKARVEVADLEKRIVDQGATRSEIQLGRLDVADARHRLEVARRQSREANEKATLDRRAAEARVRAKREEQVRKQRQLQGYDLTARRDGTVVFLRHEEDGKEVPFKTGSFARRGEGVVAIADLSRSRIEGLVSEEVAWRVETGAAATFWLPSFPDERYQAEVLRVGRLPREIPEGEGEQGFDVELRVTKGSARLQPGQRVRFAIELDRVEGAVLVPLTAILSEEGETLVVLEDGTRRRVEVGPRDTTHVAVTKGLEEGERVFAY